MKDEVVSCRHECFKDKGNLGVVVRQINCVRTGEVADEQHRRCIAHIPNQTAPYCTMPNHTKPNHSEAEQRWHIPLP